CFLICVLFSACGKSDGKVIINEIMASNSAAYTDEEGDNPDWIELFNEGDSAEDLTGWSISDEDGSKKYIFTGGSIPARGYLLLYADKSSSRTGNAENAHLPFGLSAKSGETLSLYDETGKLVSELRFPAMGADESYGVVDGDACFLEQPSPGAPNSARADTGESLTEAAFAPLGNCDVVINEYTTNDTQTITDADGDFTAWAELYNRGSEPVSLGGFYLSDDPGEPDKWMIPECEIEAGSYLLIYLNGADKTEPPSASFSLSGKEEYLLLSDPAGNETDRCRVYELFANLTCGRTPDGADEFAFFASATPGRANDRQAFSSVDSAARTGSKAPVITETAAVNTFQKAPNGEACDYIELYNPSDVAVELGRYRISDSKKKDSFLPLPEYTLNPGEYAAVYCTGDKKNGMLSVDMGLNRYGETVYLADENGAVVDSLKYRRLSDGVSCGRLLSGDLTPVYFSSLTPGAENPGQSLAAAVANPVFSVSSTYVQKGDVVKIECADPVYFTTDGSEPDETDARYTEPITINETTVLRARAFRKGALPSDIVTSTFLVEERHDLPVVFLSTDEKNLYDKSTGIWVKGSGASSVFPYEGANFWKDWERPVHFEYMTPDGVSQVSFDAGMKVFGQYSRAEEQKSVSIRLRDRYGPQEVCYPFFKDNDVNVFSSLVLRNSGQDIQSAHLRDAFCAMVLKNSMDVDIMDYQPVAVYVNGKYHGLYDLREKIDEDYLANHHGADENNTDLIKGVRDVQLGSIDNYNDLIAYIKNHDPANDDVYAYLETQIDVDDLICYWMAESFFNNTDTGNIRFYRENKDGGKWRWIFFDVDWALFPSTYRRNGIAAYLNPQGHGVNNAFSTVIMTRMMRSEKFRTRLLQLHKQHLDTTFDLDRMLSIFDAMVNEIDSEMKRHTERWPFLSYRSWQNNVKRLREIISERPQLFAKNMISTFHMTEEERQLYLPEPLR
ncbi:MAG: CotH kinase family protein, partial [Clostridia bacterium]|nr:CotH kinase family protein [Clostridia bacterium]